MNKILFVSAALAIFSILLISSASALTESDADYLVKQYSQFQLTRSCIFNGTICSSSAVCNLTMTSMQGDGTVIQNNSKMDNQGAYHNLTINPRNTSRTGWYMIFITCNDQGFSGSETSFLLVTPTGNENSTTFFIIIGLISSAIIVFGFAVKNEYIVFIGGMGMLILGLYGMVYGFGSAANDFTWMISLVIIGLGLVFTIQPAYALVESGGDTGYEEIEEIISE